MSECIPATEFFSKGSLLPNGYWAWTRRRTVYAHRHVFGECFGPIPDGHEVHHRCGKRDCVNPEHLETMPRLAHIQAHRATHCKKGHPLSGDNLMRDPFPRCRTCRNASRRARRGNNSLTEGTAWQTQT